MENKLAQKMKVEIQKSKDNIPRALRLLSETLQYSNSTPDPNFQPMTKPKL